MNFSVQAIVLFFMLTSFQLAGQEYVLNTKLYGIADGMKGRKALAATMDKDGMLWVVTDVGIDIFNGNNFLPIDNCPKELQTENFNSLLYSNDDLLWFFEDEIAPFIDFQKHTISRLKIYDKKNNNLVNPLKEIKIETIYGLDQSDDGTIWLWTTGGELYFYNTELQKYADLEQPELLMAIHGSKDKTRIVYIDKVEEWSGKKLLETIEMDFHPHASCLSDAGEVWMCHQNLGAFESSTLEEIGRLGEDGSIDLIPILQDDGYSNIYRNEIFRMGDNILIFYRSELVVYNPESRKIIFRQNMYKDEIKCVINSVLKIDDYNYWVCTVQGLLSLSIDSSNVKNYFQDESYSVRGMIEVRPDTLFVCSYSGLHLLDVNSGLFETIEDSEEHYVWNLVEWNDEKLIGGVARNAYISVDKEDFRNDIELVFFDQIKTKIINPFEVGEELWLASSPGAYKYSEVLNDFEIPEVVKNSKLSDIAVNKIQKHKGDYYFLTKKGIYITDGIEEPALFLETDRLDISDLKFDADNLWISTYGNGLFKRNAKNEKVQKFSIEDSGFPNNFIYLIHDDGLGFLWMPTNHGLIRMNKGNHSFQVYLSENGLVNNEYNNSSFYHSAKGICYFGGINGITAINPSDFIGAEKSIEIKIVWAELTSPKGGKESMDLSIGSSINLPNNYQSFEMEVSAKDLSLAHNTKYAYRISGYANEWVEMDKNRLKLNRLPFGEYNIQLRSLGSGNRVSSIYEINLEIASPFYLTVRFILLALLGLALLAYLINWNRMRKLNFRNALLKEQVATRTLELQKNNEKLTNIMQTRDRLYGIIAHDLRGPLLGFKDLGKKVKFLKRKDRLNEIDEVSDAINDNYNSLMRLLDNLLHWISVQKGQLPIEFETVLLSAHVNETINLYNQAIRDKEINLVANLNDCTILADPDAINIILRNIVNNAIKYCHQGGQINIQCKEQEAHILLEIRDDGIGMDEKEMDRIFSIKSKRGRVGTLGERSTGLGLPLTRELVQMMNAHIDVRSSPGKGSTFILEFPKA